MSFWKNFDNFRIQLNNIESNIYTSKKDFLEIYEKNLRLEAEIEERTKELQLANKRLLNVQHIWQMMNSSEPLTSVLDSIVNSLQGEFGYLTSAIVQTKEDNIGKYIDLVSVSTDAFVDKLTSIFSQKFCDIRVINTYVAERDDTIFKGEIYQSSNVDECLESMFPNVDRTMRLKVIRATNFKSYLVVPLRANDEHWGSLVVFSSRVLATEQEKTFLDLFSKQIELAITIANLFKTVKEQAVTDSLTGLNNRRYFEEHLQKEYQRAKRLNQKFTIIGIDLDHLKVINDKHGHALGDVAIKTVASVLNVNARAIDIVARMGGEEFNILLPDVDSRGGLIAAERIRAAIESKEIDTIGTITASIGVATFLEHSEDINELLELTDQAMYVSKKMGRNKVSLATVQTKDSWRNIAINTFVDLLSKHQIPLDDIMTNKLNEKLNIINNTNDSLFDFTDLISQSYNPYHINGVTKNKIRIATLLAKRLELLDNQIDNLRLAILLCDIGNLLVPFDILQKNGPLTNEERDTVQKHPIIAANEILKPITNIQEIIPIIENHHENWNGSGYPNKLSGDQIPVESQIVLIIDCYFALINSRSYRKALNRETAIKIIEDEIDKKWSASLVKEFISIIESEQD